MKKEVCRKRVRAGTLLMLFLTTGFFAMAASPVQWEVSTRPGSEGAIDIRFTARIAPQWHMYDLGPYDGGPNPTSFTFQPNSQVKLIGKIRQLDRPVRIYDSLFGMEIGYFEKAAVFSQQVRLQGAAETTLQATVEWMACDDQSCTPPQEENFTISLATSVASATRGSASTPPISGKQNDSSGNISVAASPSENNADTITRKDSSSTSITNSLSATQSSVGLSEPQMPRSLWNTLIEAILWGFAALLTPCVFPMVPMTVSYFLKGSENRRRGRLMASLYGFCIIALYTLPIGIIIAITRMVGGDTITADIFNWLATHWLPNVLFFVVFMIFAASFFGAFEITMPSWLVNRSDRKADQGGILGTFFMALTLVLVSFSCTGPIVGSVLIQSTSGEVWTPVITMFAFSTAFALPFTLFALFPTLLDRLPKGGGWLNSVKVVLGFIELALGLKFLSVADQTYHWRILDREIYLALWIVIFTLLGFYLLRKIRFSHDDEAKTIGITRLGLAIITFSFVVYMLPGMWGAPLRGLSGYLPPLYTQDFVPSLSSASSASDTSEKDSFPIPKHSDFLHLPHGLQGFFDYQEALNYARQVNKPLFVDFTGHGCVNCREMEARVWSNPEVLKLLKNDFVLVALYSDDKKELPSSEWITTDNGKTLTSIGKINAYLARKTFGINSQPYYLILDGEGRSLVPGRGYNLDIPAFMQFLKDGITNYRRSSSEK